MHKIMNEEGIPRYFDLNEEDESSSSSGSYYSDEQKVFSENDVEEDNGEDVDEDEEESFLTFKASENVNFLGLVGDQFPEKKDWLPAEPEESTGVNDQIKKTLSVLSSGNKSEKQEELDVTREDEYIVFSEKEEEGGEPERKQRRTRRELPPWVRRGGYSGRCLSLDLHNEIVDFVNYWTPTREEEELRRRAVERLRALLQTEWPTCSLEVFGSQVTGLAFPWADVDVSLYLRDVENGEEEQDDALSDIGWSLQRSGVGSNVVVIHKASVPIVKYIDSETMIPVDVAINGHDGVEGAMEVKRLVDDYPPLRPLVFVLKHFLRQRLLNETYSGGMGSYLLVLTVVSHLQMYRSNTAGMTRNRVVDLGNLLRDFFKLFGKQFVYEETGISVRYGGSYFNKMEKSWLDENKPNLLSVEDPLPPHVDVGAKSFNIQRVRSIFHYAYNVLSSVSLGMRQRNARSDSLEDIQNAPTLLSRIIRVDPEDIAFRDELRTRSVQRNSVVGHVPSGIELRKKKKSPDDSLPSISECEFISDT